MSDTFSMENAPPVTELSIAVVHGDSERRYDLSKFFALGADLDTELVAAILASMARELVGEIIETQARDPR